MNRRGHVAERIVLGVDPSTTATGFGLVRTDGYDIEAVRYGVIKTARRFSLADRLLKIFNELTEIILAFRPDEFAIEDIFYAEHTKSALKLGHARGVAMLSARLKELPVAEYSPREVKQAVVGYGNASKEQVKLSVQRMLNLPADKPLSFDAADALAVALCHCHRISRDMIQGQAAQRMHEKK